MNNSTAVLDNGRVSAVHFLLGILLGFIIFISLLSGDSEGRVNLLYLLLLFVFIPLLSLLLSMVFLLKKDSQGLAGWLLATPFWPAKVSRELLIRTPTRVRKYWLFYQTQLLSLGFGIGGFVTFMLLLLVTDISFVWRSTLLDSSDLLPTLQWLAAPWQFWTAAQPNEELLQLSQDYRLATPENTAAVLGRWWRYTCAALLCYSILPRLIMALVSRAIYSRSAGNIKSATYQDMAAVVPQPGAPRPTELAPLVSEAPERYLLVDWAGVPSEQVELLSGRFGKASARLAAEPLAEINRHQIRELAGLTPVVVVKAWEPPLGELQDYLQKLHNISGLPGLLLPLDWDKTGIKAIKENHLNEWRRFGGSLRGWSVLQFAPGAAAT